MLTTLLPHVVTIVHNDAGTRDEYGNVGTVTTDTAMSPGRMWQGPSREFTVGRDTASDEWHLILPVAATIGADDQVQWDGKTFTVDGTPAVVYDATSPHHIEAVLKYRGPVT